MIRLFLESVEMIYQQLVQEEHPPPWAERLEFTWNP
jgi:hypothetical protein